jgi:hypothetical protein
VQEKDGSDEDEGEDDDDVRVAVVHQYDCRVKVSRLAEEEEEEDRKGYVAEPRRIVGNRNYFNQHRPHVEDIPTASELTLEDRSPPNPCTASTSCCSIHLHQPLGSSWAWEP